MKFTGVARVVAATTWSAAFGAQVIPFGGPTGSLALAVAAEQRLELLAGPLHSRLTRFVPHGSLVG